jgi:hypothetical protein
MQISDTTHKYQKYDWEGIIFPLKLSQIESVSNHYAIPFDSELTIWRDNDFRLIGQIKGVVEDINDLEYRENEEIKKVGFISGETLRVKSGDSNFLIEGFGLNTINHFPVQSEKGIANGFTCEIYLESICFLNETESKPYILSELYLCSMPEVLFAHQTSRYNNHPRYKVRNDIDLPIENESEYFRTGYSSSWDFAIVKHKNF